MLQYSGTTFTRHNMAGHAWHVLLQAFSLPSCHNERGVLQWLRNWAISYGGNFMGALALVGLVAASGAFNEAAAVGPCAIAEYKCHHTWLQVCILPIGLCCTPWWALCLVLCTSIRMYDPTSLVWLPSAVHLGARCRLRSARCSSPNARLSHSSAVLRHIRSQMR